MSFISLQRRSFFGALVAVGLGLLAAAPASRAAPAANDFVRQIGTETLDALRDPSLTDEKREALVRNLLDSHLDLESVGRFCLGRYSRSLNDAQRQEYSGLFRDYLVKVYSQLLAQYNGETLDVRPTSQQAGSETLVESFINRPSGPPIRVEWKLHDKSGKLLLTDVIVEGVSMAFTQRQQFESVIQNNGGKVDALFRAMKKQIARR
ncbi:MAG TPA: ABC transporter substrate-binding protein [Ferrovibrio sp.]|uniref:MlaC/ttg2D family ABC transporter substrate-binding protein n=1 Tax=Ferrovibrio sp. TaxID=1917215 RepID=UPI002ED483BE